MSVPTDKPRPHLLKETTMTASDLHALADRLSIRGTSRMDRDRIELQQDMRLAAGALRALLPSLAPATIIVDEQGHGRRRPIEQPKE